MKNIKMGTKIKFATGNDKDKVFVILSRLNHCARTEGCYKAKYEDSEIEVYIFPDTLKELGYSVVN